MYVSSLSFVYHCFSIANIDTVNGEWLQLEDFSGKFHDFTEEIFHQLPLFGYCEQVFIPWKKRVLEANEIINLRTNGFLRIVDNL